MKNMSKKKVSKTGPFLLLAALMIAVVFTSGCVIQSLLSIFGSDVIKVSRTEQTVGTNNAIVISDKYTLPEKTVLPDTNLQLFINIQNQDNDANKVAKNVYINLFDASVFKGVYTETVSGKAVTKAVLCNKDQSKCQPDVCGIKSACTMYMGSERPMTFMLRSPTLGEIANIITDAKLHFLVSYDYSGSSSYEVLVVDYNEIVRRQRAGESLSTTLNQVRGSGPVVIDVAERIPFITSSADKTTSTDSMITFTIRDRGNGEPKNSSIEPGKFRIEFPNDLVQGITHLQGDIDMAASGGAQTSGGTGTPSGTTTMTEAQCDAKCTGCTCVDTSNDQYTGKNSCQLGSGHDWCNIDIGSKCCIPASTAATGAVTGLATSAYYLCRNQGIPPEADCYAAGCPSEKQRLITTYNSNAACDTDRDLTNTFYCEATAVSNGNPSTLSCYNLPNSAMFAYEYVLDPSKTVCNQDNAISTVQLGSIVGSGDGYELTNWFDGTDQNGQPLKSGTYTFCVHPYVQQGGGEFTIYKGTVVVSAPAGTSGVPQTTRRTTSSSGTPSSSEQGTIAATTQPTFKCYQGTGDKQDKFICENIKAIKLFRDESDKLWFKINDVKYIDVPHRSFYINAYVNYTYELRDFVDIQIKPPTY